MRREHANGFVFSRPVGARKAIESIRIDHHRFGRLIEQPQNDVPGFVRRSDSRPDRDQTFACRPVPQSARRPRAKSRPNRSPEEARSSIPGCASRLPRAPIRDTRPSPDPRLRAMPQFPPSPPRPAFSALPPPPEHARTCPYSNRSDAAQTAAQCFPAL